MVIERMKEMGVLFTFRDAYGFNLLAFNGIPKRGQTGSIRICPAPFDEARRNQFLKAVEAGMQDFALQTRRLQEIAASNSTLRERGIFVLPGGDHRLKIVSQEAAKAGAQTLNIFVVDEAPDSAVPWDARFPASINPAPNETVLLLPVIRRHAAEAARAVFSRESDATILRLLRGIADDTDAFSEKAAVLLTEYLRKSALWKTRLPPSTDGRGDVNARAQWLATLDLLRMKGPRAVFALPNQATQTGEEDPFLWLVLSGLTGFEPTQRREILSVLDDLAKNGGDIAAAGIEERTIVEMERMIIETAALAKQPVSSSKELSEPAAAVAPPSANGTLTEDSNRKPPQLSDKEILRQLTEIKEKKILERFAWSIGVDENIIDDVVQMTLLRAWERRGIYFPKNETMNAWLFVILKNVLSTEYSRLRSEQRLLSDWPDFYETPFEAGKPMDTERQVVARLEVQRLLEMLSPGEREEFRHTFLADEEARARFLAAVGFEYLDEYATQYAKKLGVPSNTVNTTLFRGRKVLTELLAREKMRLLPGDSGVMTLGPTRGFGKWFLRKLGNPDPTDRDVELSVAPWFELIWTLPLYFILAANGHWFLKLVLIVAWGSVFVFQHDNKDPVTGKIDWMGKILPRVVGVAGIVVVSWAVVLAPVEMKWVWAAAGQTLFHLIHNVLVPNAALDMGSWNPGEKVRKAAPPRTPAGRFFSQLLAPAEIEKFNWRRAEREGRLPVVGKKGIPLGKTRKRGSFKFNINGRPFEWVDLGVSEDGWEAVVTRGRVVGEKNGWYEMTVTFTKGEERVVQMYRIGRKTRSSGVLAIERLHPLGRWLEPGEVDFAGALRRKELPDWEDDEVYQGFEIGNGTDELGRLFFSPFSGEGFSYIWSTGLPKGSRVYPLLGRSQTEDDGRTSYVLKVRIEFGGKSRTGYVRVGPDTRTLTHQRDKNRMIDVFDLTFLPGPLQVVRNNLGRELSDWVRFADLLDADWAETEGDLRAAEFVRGTADPFPSVDELEQAIARVKDRLLKRVLEIMSARKFTKREVSLGMPREDGEPSREDFVNTLENGRRRLTLDSFSKLLTSLVAVGRSKGRPLTDGSGDAWSEWAVHSHERFEAVRREEAAGLERLESLQRRMKELNVPGTAIGPMFGFGESYFRGFLKAKTIKPELAAAIEAKLLERENALKDGFPEEVRLWAESGRAKGNGARKALSLAKGPLTNIPWTVLDEALKELIESARVNLIRRVDAMEGLAEIFGRTAVAPGTRGKAAPPGFDVPLSKEAGYRRAGVLNDLRHRRPETEFKREHLEAFHPMLDDLVKRWNRLAPGIVRSYLMDGRVDENQFYSDPVLQEALSFDPDGDRPAPSSWKPAISAARALAHRRLLQRLHELKTPLFEIERKLGVALHSADGPPDYLPLARLAEIHSFLDGVEDERLDSLPGKIRRWFKAGRLVPAGRGDANLQVLVFIDGKRGSPSLRSLEGTLKDAAEESWSNFLRRSRILRADAAISRKAGFLSSWMAKAHQGWVYPDLDKCELVQKKMNEVERERRGRMSRPSMLLWDKYHNELFGWLMQPTLDIQEWTDSDPANTKALHFFRGEMADVTEEDLRRAVSNAKKMAREGLLRRIHAANVTRDVLIAEADIPAHTLFNELPLSLESFSVLLNVVRRLEPPVPPAPSSPIGDAVARWKAPLLEIKGDLSSREGNEPLSPLDPNLEVLYKVWEESDDWYGRCPELGIKGPRMEALRSFDVTLGNVDRSEVKILLRGVNNSLKSLGKLEKAFRGDRKADRAIRRLMVRSKRPVGGVVSAKGEGFLRNTLAPALKELTTIERNLLKAPATAVLLIEEWFREERRGNTVEAEKILRELAGHLFPPVREGFERFLALLAFLETTFPEPADELESNTLQHLGVNLGHRGVALDVRIMEGDFFRRTDVRDSVVAFRLGDDRLAVLISRREADRLRTDFPDGRDFETAWARLIVHEYAETFLGISHEEAMSKGLDAGPRGTLRLPGESLDDYFSRLMKKVHPSRRSVNTPTPAIVAAPRTRLPTERPVPANDGIHLGVVSRNAASAVLLLNQVYDGFSSPPSPEVVIEALGEAYPLVYRSLKAEEKLEIAGPETILWLEFLEGKDPAGTGLGLIGVALARRTSGETGAEGEDFLKAVGENHPLMFLAKKAEELGLAQRNVGPSLTPKHPLNYFGLLLSGDISYKPEIGEAISALLDAREKQLREGFPEEVRAWVEAGRLPGDNDVVVEAKALAERVSHKELVPWPVLNEAIEKLKTVSRTVLLGRIKESKIPGVYIAEPAKLKDRSYISRLNEGRPVEMDSLRKLHSALDGLLGDYDLIFRRLKELRIFDYELEDKSGIDVNNLRHNLGYMRAERGRKLLSDLQGMESDRLREYPDKLRRWLDAGRLDYDDWADRSLRNLRVMAFIRGEAGPPSWDHLFAALDDAREEGWRRFKNRLGLRSKVIGNRAGYSPYEIQHILAGGLSLTPDHLNDFYPVLVRLTNERRDSLTGPSRDLWLEYHDVLSGWMEALPKDVGKWRKESPARKNALNFIWGTGKLKKSDLEEALGDARRDGAEWLAAQAVESNLNSEDICFEAGIPKGTLPDAETLTPQLFVRLSNAIRRLKEASAEKGSEPLGVETTVRPPEVVLQELLAKDSARRTAAFAHARHVAEEWIGDQIRESKLSAEEVCVGAGLPKGQSLPRARALTREAFVRLSNTIQRLQNAAAAGNSPQPPEIVQRSFLMKPSEGIDVVWDKDGRHCRLLAVVQKTVAGKPEWFAEIRGDGIPSAAPTRVLLRGNVFRIVEKESSSEHERKENLAPVMELIGRLRGLQSEWEVPIMREVEGAYKAAGMQGRKIIEAFLVRRLLDRRLEAAEAKRTPGNYPEQEILKALGKSVFLVEHGARPGKQVSDQKSDQAIRRLMKYIESYAGTGQEKATPGLVTLSVRDGRVEATAWYFPGPRNDLVGVNLVKQSKARGQKGNIHSQRVVELLKLGDGTMVNGKADAWERVDFQQGDIDLKSVPMEEPVDGLKMISLKWVENGSNGATGGSVRRETSPDFGAEEQEEESVISRVEADRLIAQHGLTRLILRGLPASWTRTVRREAIWTWVLELTVNFLVPFVLFYFGAAHFGVADPGLFVLKFMSAWGALFLVMHGRRQSWGLVGTALLLTTAYGGAASAFLLGGWWIAAGIALVAVAGKYHVLYDLPGIAERRAREERLQILNFAIPLGESLSVEKILPGVVLSDRPGRGLEALSDGKRNEILARRVALWAETQADLDLIGKDPDGEFVVNGTELFRTPSEREGPLDRQIFTAWVGALARRTKVILAVGDGSIAPKSAEELTRMFPGKGLRGIWASETPGLRSLENDGRTSLPKLSALGCRTALGWPSVDIYSLRKESVALDDPKGLARAIGLERLVHVLEEVQRSLLNARYVSRNA